MKRIAVRLTRRPNYYWFGNKRLESGLNFDNVAVHNRHWLYSEGVAHHFGRQKSNDRLSRCYQYYCRFEGRVLQLLTVNLVEIFHQIREGNVPICPRVKSYRVASGQATNSYGNISKIWVSC